MTDGEAIEWLADACDAWLSDFCGIMTPEQVAIDTEAIKIARRIAKELLQ